MVPEALAVFPINAAGISPLQTVAVVDVIVPTEVIPLAVIVIEATLVQLLKELTTTSITSPPLKTME